MTFTTFLDYACLVSVILSVVIAVDRNVPLIEAIRPPESKKVLVWQFIMLAWVAMLWAIHLAGCPSILGQHPLDWARFMLLLSVWLVLGNFTLRPRG